jgi:hypothetical protein
MNVKKADELLAAALTLLQVSDAADVHAWVNEHGSEELNVLVDKIHRRIPRAKQLMRKALSGGTTVYDMERQLREALMQTRDHIRDVESLEAALQKEIRC